MWIPRQISFWPVVESAYNAQNAQFGLVIFHPSYKQMFQAGRSRLSFINGTLLDVQFVLLFFLKFHIFVISEHCYLDFIRQSHFSGFQPDASSLVVIKNRF